jgi:hypothetical protein
MHNLMSLYELHVLNVYGIREQALHMKTDTGGGFD